MNLTQFSLKYPLFILCFWGGIIFFGLFYLFEVPVTRFPASEQVIMSVSSAYPGAGTERVLEDVTKKLENKLNRINGLEDIISTTQNERSEIDLYFKSGISPEEAEGEILLSITQAKNELPAGAQQPIVKKVIRQNKPLIRLAATSSLEPVAFYDTVTESIQPVFEQIKGVSNVAILGKREPQATVLLDLEKMKERELSASSVVSRLKKIGEDAYLGENTSYLISGEYSSLQDLGSVVIHYLSNDKVIALNDIATIRHELSDPKEYTYFNGSPCLLLEIFERQDGDTLAIEKLFEQTLSKLQRELKRTPGNISLTVLKDSGAFLAYTYFDFKRSLWISLAVSVLLIWAVFKDLRSILVSSISIPCALCAIFIVLHLMGKTLNYITLGAMILSMGLIIDDMIVIRENIFRHLQKGKNPFEGTIEAMKEIGRPVIGTTCAIIAGCFTLTFMGNAGILQYATEFAFIIIIAVIFSLLEAFTLGPVLCAYCLVHKSEKSNQKIQKWIGGHYKKLLKWAMGHSRKVIVCGFAILLLSLVSYHFLNKRLVPLNIIGNLEMQIKMSSNLSLKEAKDKALYFSNYLIKEYPDIAQIGLLVQDQNETVMNIQMVEENMRALSPMALKQQLDRSAEKLLLKHEIDSYYVEEGSSDSPTHLFDFELYLTSSNHDRLVAYNEDLYKDLQNFKGIVNLTNSYNRSDEETSFVLDFPQMNRLGVLTDPAAKELSLLLNGYKASPYHPLHKQNTLRAAIEVKSDLYLSKPKDLLLKSFVPNINLTMVPLNNLISGITHHPSRPILRKNGEEAIQITADFYTGLHQSTNPLDYAEKLIQTELLLPKGMSTSWSGNAKNQKELFGQLDKVIILAAIFLYITLVILYQSMTIPLIILAPLPLSISGTYFALFLTGYSMNIFSIIGAVLAVGISAKNGIILVDYINHLLDRGLPLTHAITIACKIRLRPILMTSAAVFLTTLPIIIVWNEYARLEVSMGIAVLGGLVSSTLLSLFLMPAIYKHSYTIRLWFHRFVFRFINTPPEEKP